MRLAVDAMGGDHGPAPAVTGAVAAAAANPDLTVVLVGDKAQVEPLLNAANPPAGRAEVVHASQVVGMDEKPADAFRKKPDNSIAQCWKLVATKQVDGLVSAGNTGAVVAGGLFTRRFLKGVKRPGIATVMPTARGRSVLMDVGANVFPKPLHLLQYGVMGSVFARHMLGCDRPAIGLMNVGEEEGKGHDLVLDTYKLFRNSPMRDRFLGNIEGRDLPRGKADVVVCDGFVGNVVLKLSEGLFEFLMTMVGHEVVAKLPNDRTVAAAAVKGLVDKYHYSAFGGAPLLGVDGVCIICHGSSDQRAIANALAVAAQDVRVRLNEKIVDEIQALPAGEDE
jgi:glycerol-3-phosphate acyltransferase PlsX